MDLLIEDLRERLARPLPGQAAQFRMASLRRLEELGPRLQAPDNAKVACVLVLFHQAADEPGHWRTVLIQRTANPNDRHSGQVSFPGGRWEESDGSLEAVALREAHEEVGISPLQVQLVGRLTDLYIPVSNFLVHPFVGVLRGEAQMKPQPGEVEHILTPPVAHFLQPENRLVRDLIVGPTVTMREVPYFEIDGRVVWGATAMILSELVEVLAQ